nr:hypothetical protein CFP56_69936 [Quercus suber]
MAIDHKPLNSLLTKFLKIDGFDYDYTTKFGGNAQQIQALTANVQELMKQNKELKRKVHLEGTSILQSQCNCNDNDNEGQSPENSRWETSKHTAQSTRDSDQM